MVRPALVAAVVALATAPLAAQPAPQDIVIAMPNFTFTSTPNFIAEELGLWARHGLRVKIIQIAGIGATNAVIAGSADFVQAGGSTLTRAAARGQRLLAIANTASAISWRLPCARRSPRPRASTPRRRWKSARPCFAQDLRRRRDQRQSACLSARGRIA